MSKAALMRDEIARLDLPHRKGFCLSEGDGKWPTLSHLKDEVKELEEALLEYDTENARMEVADVFVCLLQVANRLGMTFEDLDKMAVYKMQIRFNGADKIVV
jgi:hypothetical protein